MLTLFDYLPSQNAWKIRQLLAQLQLGYRTEFISIFEGQGQQPAYLQINPTGAVPAIRLVDGRVLAESNAILSFLARGTEYLPDAAFEQAKAMQWLCFEGDYVQSSIATLRHWTLTGKSARRPQELIASKRATSIKVLEILDRELTARCFLAGEAYSIADISIYAYVHLAADADLPIGDFKAVQRWLERVRAQPRHLAQVYPYSIDPSSVRELA